MSRTRDQSGTSGFRAGKAASRLLGRLAGWVADHRGLSLLGFLVLLAIEMALTYMPTGFGDEGGYRSYGQALLDGPFWNTRYPGEFTWWGPGLPTLLTPLILLKAPLVVARIILGPVIVAATAAVLWRVLLVDVGPRVAAVGAMGFSLLVLYLGLGPVQIVPLGAILSEPATGLAIASALLCWLKCRKSKSRVLVVSAGLWLAAATMIRVEWGLIISVGLVLATLVFLGHRTTNSRNALIALTVALLACLPWLAYTRSETGEYFVWGTSGGLSLYWTAVAKPPLQGDWISPRTVAADPRFAPFRRDMAYGLGMEGRPARWDSYLRSVAIDRIASDPTNFARNVGKNLSRLTTGQPLSFLPVSRKAYLRAVPLMLLLVAVATTAVLVTLRRRWRLVAFAPVFGLVSNLMIHVVTSAVPRFIYPMLPLMVWFLCRGIVVLRDSTGPASNFIEAAPRSGQA